VNDLAGANATIQKYFSTLYQNQVEASGEQVRMVFCNKLNYRDTPIPSLLRRCGRGHITTGATT
jgi:hypothetical protein